MISDSCVGNFFVDVQNPNVYRCESAIEEMHEDTVLMLTRNDLQVELVVNMKDYPQDPIYVQNRRLLEEELYCDLEIESVDARVFKCHKSVLSGK